MVIVSYRRYVKIKFPQTSRGRSLPSKFIFSYLVQLSFSNEYNLQTPSKTYFLLSTTFLLQGTTNVPGEEKLHYGEKRSYHSGENTFTG